MGKVIAIANQKGGVGKTTTAVNLGACLAVAGRSVLIIDMDPQSNATSGLGYSDVDVSESTYPIIIDESDIEERIKATGVDDLFVVPASRDLTGAEVELVSVIGREFKLKQAIEKIRDRYDFILVDCPPSLGLLTINSLVAADSVLIPIQCEYYALEGIVSLMRTIDLIKRNLNRDLKLEGILLTMYDSRTNLSQQVVDEVKRYFGVKVYETIIPRNVRLSEAPSFGKPIIMYDILSKGAEAYLNLAEEVMYGG
ncbi:MAG TPA: ParA family protein [Firmicutes bacterium]|nr:MAG: ParA family protein [Candidatus Coatesbacteria bacterium]RLC41043.1 MAG: ParA family protein [Candidatus Coatesbacteria bacterium]RLC43325.1 MAG: ParA family protein [Candidatus Coatesbacteria bacterium]HDM43484.1 ParA family protein [Bacillota bacterium]